MPVNVIYDPECDQNFRNQYEAAFQRWINQNPRHRVDAGDIEFDQAVILNGLHPTTSTWDPNSVPHVTIRLSTPTLRGRQSWHVLHWRPSGQSRVAPQPDNEPSNSKRRAQRKAKKQRQLQRKRDGKDKDGEDGEEGAAGAAKGGSGTPESAARVPGSSEVRYS